MARSLDGLPDYLRARGFQVDGVPGWRSRKRPAYTGGFDPRGIVAHHTGGGGGGIGYASTTLKNGFRTLPGPLCQINLSRDGTVIFVAAGRANHAGKVRSVGFMRAGDGNSQALGIEADNTGTEGWKHPAPGWGTQYDAYIALCAAIEDYMGWKRGSVLGHGEVSTAGKWDPGVRDGGRNRMLDMDVFRERVKAVRFNTDTPAPEPEPEQPATPAPTVTPRWFKIALINHAAASALFKKPANVARWLKRRKRLVLEVKDINADVFGGLECGSGFAWHYLTTKYKKFGYVLIPKGRGGRHLWRKKSVKLVASGYFDPPRFEGDDKPAPWAVVEPDGSRALVVLGHLEPSDATGSMQVRQARSIVNEAEEKAAEFGIGPSRIFYLMDTASDNRVRDEVFGGSGYADAFDAAAKSVNESVKSFNEWKAPQPGPRVDLIAVHRGKGGGEGDEYARPVIVVSQRLTTSTDHHHQAAVVGRQS